MREWFRSYPFVLLLLPLVACIILCQYAHWPSPLSESQPYLDTEHTFYVEVDDYPQERAKTWRYTISILAYEDSVLTYAHGRACVYIRKDSTRVLPTMGDTLWLKTTISDGRCYVNSHHWQLIAPATRPHGVIAWARYCQMRLYQRYVQWGITAPELGTIAALSLGYREDLDDDVQRAFQRAGAMHVLAVSGLHTGIIYAMLMAICTGFGWRKPRYEERGRRVVISVIVIICLWLYAFLTGLSPSVVRAVIMCTLVQVAYMCYRRPVSGNTLAAAAFLILCFRPTDLFSVSFQLSFAAVAAILVLEPYLKSICRWSLLSVSIAAQLGTLPLTLYYFGQTSNYFLITNIIVLPLATVVVPLAMLTLLLGGIPVLGTALVWLLTRLTWLMNTTVGWVEHWPGCVEVRSISLPMVACYYIALVGGYLALKRSLWWLVVVAASLATYCLLYL